MDVAEEELQGLYTWVDEIPLSRPKRNIARDFSDGVLVAEVVAHFFPRLVQLHNYSSANALQQKMYNWNTLNQKVFRKLGLQLSKQDCEDIANAVPGAIERVLKLARITLASYTGCDLGSSSMGSPGQLVHSNDSSSHATPDSTHSAPRPPSSKVYSPGLPQGAAGQVAQLSVEQGQHIQELRETNELLETKVRKLEQLVKLKDAKIQTLMAKLQAAGLV